ncbi:hypothetical protein DFH07DRAFT_241598 [Mycena maculata]|uniref:Uncharacterized protein n=1 Tax=Mycena maculata TaxID=230809 RepID=A0AAD7JSR4_9AGAR|nr:hypothetical protein DFH07DRAFT_241598 [Mycena maculata]
MIVSEGDRKGATEPSAQPEAARDPPPAYTASSSTVISESAPTATDAGPIQIIVQHPSPVEEMPSAFQPPSPSSFPHPHPHTRVSSSGPTPLFLPTVAPSADGYYAYYDPRSPHSLALADKRAFARFWSAFTCAIGLLLFLWLVGLIQLGPD